MNIFYEDSMPYAAEFFAELGECKSFSHKTVDAYTLKDADILLTRSTTKVNEELLHLNKKLQFVGTATAGTDHVNQDYLKVRGIPFTSAGGCNAVAVAEYVLSAMLVMANKYDWDLGSKTVGIVGAGHVGTALSKVLDALGMEYLLCDPPLEVAGDIRRFVSLDKVMECDIISLHVPLVQNGPFVTEHMFDESKLALLSEEQLLINACRGEVIDNSAALKLFKERKRFNLVLDVWENEPAINLNLLPYIELATAHIAGHTIEGKARGTEMLYSALCQHLSISAEKQLVDYLPEANPHELAATEGGGLWQTIHSLVLDIYNIAEDDRLFRAQMVNAETFRYIRKHYPIRREFSAIQVNTGNSTHSKAIYQLGFLPK